MDCESARQLSIVFSSADTSSMLSHDDYLPISLLKIEEQEGTVKSTELQSG
jgi:hypothetical protein